MLTNHFYPLSKPVSPEMCLSLEKAAFMCHIVDASTWLAFSFNGRKDRFF